MSPLKKDIVFMILKFLGEGKLKETVHMLEQECGFYFNMEHFEDLVQAGQWDEVERYLSGFTKVDDNQYSMKIFLEVRKQKYLEALESNDRTKAAEIFVKDLKVFYTYSEEIFKEVTMLLDPEKYSKNKQLSKCRHTKLARNIMFMELKKLIEANPLLNDKLNFPSFSSNRLEALVNQSLNWQHYLCKDPQPDPDIETLFTDHSCASSANGARPPPASNEPFFAPPSNSAAFRPSATHSPFQPVVSQPASAMAGWMANANPPLTQDAPVVHLPHFGQPSSFTSFLSNPRLHIPDAVHLMKRIHIGQPDEVSLSDATHQHTIFPKDGIPQIVIWTFNQGSDAMSLDFHPIHTRILLVGTNVGDITIWEVGSRERIAHKTFRVRDIDSCSLAFKTVLAKDASVTVKRCMWCPDGSILGVAFSKHLVQTYTFDLNRELHQMLEIDAHVGSVNDIAFSRPNNSLSIVTCGDDKTIKVWDTKTGQKQYIFEGHQAPVYSVCPHYKESIQFIFSTAIDGKIKVWIYDCLESKIDFDPPGHWCTRMQYSTDGTRLFSCGTSKDGETLLMEWNEGEGSIKRIYSGLRKNPSEVVQFDTTKNHFLVAGDDFAIKFWDLDNANILHSIVADGGLPLQASPKVKFNREGTLLAVTTNNCRIKILANADGQRIVMMNEGSRGPSQHISTNVKVDFKPPKF
ncbi:protein TOPLESS-RELATED PROTEIN 2-like [Zingiber officinale]|uniref:protein TOPLESS-RELATED PROTEIN 2-like n=1 Tax=Zingiber officinale TaxID=94328 RepID=UPI001C4B41F0|nr:protein TOPLESS-RELATED PROTEIN 2-like [Zingiber officinale]